MNDLTLIGRQRPLFEEDLSEKASALNDLTRGATFLIIGAAGSIGRAVAKAIFAFSPSSLHLIDISENNLVELVRDLRSSSGDVACDLKTFAIDAGGVEFEYFLKKMGKYDYVFNLSALKHVRGERDEFTLMRMINVNILNVLRCLDYMKGAEPKKYFCVSTDKAANPANMMGASKRIMEMFLNRKSDSHLISMARFANVAFSDGSLLHGFQQRISKRQPISAPIDVKRYFITSEESAQLCLFSALLGDNRDIFFPKLSERLNLITFADIAMNFLEGKGFEPVVCHSEEEARIRARELIPTKKWPCFFFDSDTSGEKDFEEFFTNEEHVDFERFSSIGIIKNPAQNDDFVLDRFLSEISKLYNRKYWSKEEIVALFKATLPSFSHKETGKNLDQRM